MVYSVSKLCRDQTVYVIFSSCHCNQYNMEIANDIDIKRQQNEQTAFCAAFLNGLTLCYKCLKHGRSTKETNKNTNALHLSGTGLNQDTSSIGEGEEKGGTMQDRCSGGNK